jgi:hypothetical protein
MTTAHTMRERRTAVRRIAQAFFREIEFLFSI